MHFYQTELAGAYRIETQKAEDQRGFFARAWCEREFAEAGIGRDFVQSNFSHSVEKGTLRGLHYQLAPYQEAKLVRCIRGSLFDVLVDLRANSPTYKRWVGIELSESNNTAVFVPEGFAHGFLTLEPDTIAFYQVSQYYTPEAERGFRYNDPAFDIAWPEPIEIISPKDENWELYKD
jgi:dTDP-4-dehydrorhamnose 3,5-epimerase